VITAPPTSLFIMVDVVDALVAMEMDSAMELVDTEMVMETVSETASETDTETVSEMALETDSETDLETDSETDSAMVLAMETDSLMASEEIGMLQIVAIQIAVVLVSATVMVSDAEVPTAEVSMTSIIDQSDVQNTIRQIRHVLLTLMETTLDSDIQTNSTTTTLFFSTLHIKKPPTTISI